MSVKFVSRLGERPDWLRQLLPQKAGVFLASGNILMGAGVFTLPARCFDMGRVHSPTACQPHFYCRKSHRSYGRAIIARREVSMWYTCYAVFVIPTAISLALVALDAWVY